MSLLADILVALGALFLVFLGAAWAHRRDGTASHDHRWGRRVPPVVILVGALFFPLGPSGRGAAEGPCPGVVRPLTAFAFESVTVSAAAIGLTATTMISGNQVAVAARLSVETSSIRLREDGTDPTAAVGDQRDPGDRFWVCGTSLNRLKMIRTAAPDAIVRVTYFRVL